MLNPYIEAWQIRELIAKKELKPREVAEFFNRRIEQLNPKLGAYMTATPERAMADVARLEKASAADIAKMPLFGIPYSLKDLTWTKDIRTTMGSKNYENYMPPLDGEVTVRMRNAGGVLLGKEVRVARGHNSVRDEEAGVAVIGVDPVPLPRIVTEDDVRSHAPDPRAHLPALADARFQLAVGPAEEDNVAFAAEGK